MADVVAKQIATAHSDAIMHLATALNQFSEIAARGGFDPDTVQRMNELGEPIVARLRILLDVDDA